MFIKSLMSKINTTLTRHFFRNPYLIRKRAKGSHRIKPPSRALEFS